MLVNGAKFITSAAVPAQFIKSEKPIIAVVGKSNVGKSSFINALANQNKLAKTSNTPGRTRLINYFDFGEFIIADLPGYGYAKVSKEEKERWGKVMDKFFADKANVDYVFSLLDIRHPPTADDLTMINYLHKTAYSYVFIATKADKISKMQVGNRVKEIAAVFKVTTDKITAFSAETKQGKKEIEDKLDIIIPAIKQQKASE